MQQALRVPYLNVFSNYSRLDACMQCVPGHDVVHERNGIYNGAVATACRRFSLPYVVFFDADQLVEREPMGMPITGWLAAGLAVVGSRSGQLATILDEGCSGLLVSPGDTVALGHALTALFDDSGLRARLGAEARADAVAKHSWDTYVSRLETLYSRVTVGRSVSGL